MAYAAIGMLRSALRIEVDGRRRPPHLPDQIQIQLTHRTCMHIDHQTSISFVILNEFRAAFPGDDSHPRFA